MSKAAKDHRERVAALGCIVCRLQGLGWSPASIHHIRDGMGMGQRNDDFHAIGLCPIHHQTGGFGVAFHAGPREFQKNFGTETELLESVQALLELREAM